MGEVTQRFFLLLGYVSQLICIPYKTSGVGFKSRESPGHLKTDVPLIAKVCFADLGLIQRTLPCRKKTNSFRILYWYVTMHGFEGVLYVMKRRCESLFIN